MPIREEMESPLKGKRGKSSMVTRRTSVWNRDVGEGRRTIFIPFGKRKGGKVSTIFRTKRNVAVELHHLWNVRGRRISRVQGMVGSA